MTGNDSSRYLTNLTLGAKSPTQSSTRAGKWRGTGRRVIPMFWSWPGHEETCWEGKGKKQRERKGQRERETTSQSQSSCHEREKQNQGKEPAQARTPPKSPKESQVNSCQCWWCLWPGGLAHRFDLCVRSFTIGSWSAFLVLQDLVALQGIQDDIFQFEAEKTYHSQFVRCTCCKATLSLRLYPEELDHCFAWGRTSVDWLCVSGSVWPWLFLYIYRSQITYCSAQGLCPKLLYQDSGLAKGGGVQWSKWHFFLRLVINIYIICVCVCAWQPWWWYL